MVRRTKVQITLEARLEKLAKALEKTNPKLALYVTVALATFIYLLLILPRREYFGGYASESLNAPDSKGNARNMAREEGLRTLRLLWLSPWAPLLVGDTLAAGVADGLELAVNMFKHISSFWGLGDTGERAEIDSPFHMALTQLYYPHTLRSWTTFTPGGTPVFRDDKGRYWVMPEHLRVLVAFQMAVMPIFAVDGMAAVLSGVGEIVPG